jgi:probable HAF family extracellular repeat protein
VTLPFFTPTSKEEPMTSQTVRIAFAALTLLASLAASAAPLYKIEPLKNQDGMRPRYPDTINNHGVVMGTAQDLANRNHYRVFFHDHGQLTFLADGDGARVQDFNDAGDVLVQVPLAPAIFWHDGRYQEAPKMSLVSRFNNQGVMAGNADFGQETHAAIWDNGTITDLGTLGGPYASATDVSDNGFVVGESTINPDNWNKHHAFIWANGQMKDLGTFGGDTSYAYVVNNLGHVLGTAKDENDVFTPFFYDGVKKRRLPTLGSATLWPRDMNNADEIAGSSSVGAFITTGGRSHLLMDLLDSSREGWDRLDDIVSINDGGDVTGTGYFRGNRKAFVARRIEP